MSDGELLCNFKKCRKVLTGIAYITRCSHAFCEEDGMRQIESQHFDKICPACQSPLAKNYDLVKVTLNPNDQFKSMVLAGLRPEVVMDVASRAIAFWSYQQHQEQLHQSMISKSLKDFIGNMKSESELEIGMLKSEIQSLKRKQEDLQKELEKQTLKCNELSEKLAEKTRELQKWQMSCESLRRKQLSAMVLQRETNLLQENPMALNMRPVDDEDDDDSLTNRQKSLRGPYPKGQAENYEARGGIFRHMKSPSRREPDGNDRFVFQPRTLNSCSVSPKVFFEGGGNHRINEGQRKYRH